MKTGNLTAVYGAAAIISALLLFSYLFREKKKNGNFLFLTICVSFVNLGYFLLAAANSLYFAMIANGISYFGAAYSVLAMLFIIWDVCRLPKRKWLKFFFITVTTCAFLLAASGSSLGLYYTSVRIENASGMTRLITDYGPLHRLYSVYLLGYVLLMVAMILWAWRKKRLASFKYAMLLMAAVLLNMFVWAVEQSVDVGFEFLSISYIVTEVFLLLLYGMLEDYGIVDTGGSLLSVQMLTRLNTHQVDSAALPPDMEALFQSFSRRAATLSAAEKRILKYYIEGYEIAQIPEMAFVSIHTVKKHNHSIYSKLDIASRDELMLYIELFRCCDRLDELTDITDN